MAQIFNPCSEQRFLIKLLHIVYLLFVPVTVYGYKINL